jgi:DNA-binding XRE family transcriptional regulator
LTREEFIKIIDEKLKLIRSEYGYTQDKMADILGISKKTLVQIEKGRSSLGWTGAVALCTIFRGSEILDMISGGQSQDIILTLSFNGYESSKYEKTLGGKVWWKDIESKGNFKVQQNIISQHYRILDREDRRIFSAFEFDLVKKRLEEL